MTMLEKAKAHRDGRPGRPKSFLVNEEMIELCVALMRGDVSINQAMHGMDLKSRSNFSWRVMSSLIEACQNSKITIARSKSMSRLET